MQVLPKIIVKKLWNYLNSRSLRKIDFKSRLQRTMISYNFFLPEDGFSNTPSYEKTLIVELLSSLITKVLCSIINLKVVTASNAESSNSSQGNCPDFLYVCDSPDFMDTLGKQILHHIQKGKWSLRKWLFPFKKTILWLDITFFGNKMMIKMVDFDLVSCLKMKFASRWGSPYTNCDFSNLPASYICVDFIGIHVHIWYTYLIKI